MDSTVIIEEVDDSNTDAATDKAFEDKVFETDVQTASTHQDNIFGDEINDEEMEQLMKEIGTAQTKSTADLYMESFTASNYTAESYEIGGRFQGAYAGSSPKPQTRRNLYGKIIDAYSKYRNNSDSDSDTESNIEDINRSLHSVNTSIDLIKTYTRDANTTATFIDCKVNVLSKDVDKIKADIISLGDKVDKNTAILKDIQSLMWKIYSGEDEYNCDN